MKYKIFLISLLSMGIILSACSKDTDSNLNNAKKEVSSPKAIEMTDYVAESVLKFKESLTFYQTVELPSDPDINAVKLPSEPKTTIKEYTLDIRTNSLEGEYQDVLGNRVSASYSDDDTTFIFSARDALPDLEITEEFPPQIINGVLYRSAKDKNFPKPAHIVGMKNDNLYYDFSMNNVDGLGYYTTLWSHAKTLAPHKNQIDVDWSLIELPTKLPFENPVIDTVYQIKEDVEKQKKTTMFLFRYVEKENNSNGKNDLQITIESEKTDFWRPKDAKMKVEMIEMKNGSTVELVEFEGQDRRVVSWKNGEWFYQLNVLGMLDINNKDLLEIVNSFVPVEGA